MLKIGFVRLQDWQPTEDTARLMAAGCHVVRAEEPSAGSAGEAPVLDSILDFMGAGDQLVVMRLEHLCRSARMALEVIDRLDARGAALHVIESDIGTSGEGGRALRAALTAVAALEPAWPSRARRAAPPAQEIRALQEAGVGPVEIARRLGVSRMTVWRKLRALETAQLS